MLLDIFRANLEEELNAALDRVAVQDLQEHQQEETQGITHCPIQHTLQMYHLHYLMYCNVTDEC